MPSDSDEPYSEEPYSEEFVASILEADAADPEASFDNIIDLLEWLNRAE